MKRILNCLTFLFLLFTSCTTYNIDVHKKQIIESSGNHLKTIMQKHDSKKIYASNPEHYYLYALLYLNNNPFDSFALKLLQKAIKIDNVFQGDAFDLLFELSCASKEKNAVSLFLKEYPSPPQEAKYNKITSIVAQKKKDYSHLKEINNNPSFFSFYEYLINSQANDFDLIKPYFYNYLSSLYNKKDKELKVSPDSLLHISKITSTPYIRLLHDLSFQKEIVTTELLVNGMLDVTNYQDLQTIEAICINEPKLKNMYEDSLSIVKNTSNLYTYSWIVYFRPIKGHNAISFDLKNIINTFDKKSDEYYQLKAFDLYSNRERNEKYYQELVEFNNIFPSMYHSYTLLSDGLRYILKNNLSNKYQNICSNIIMNGSNHTRNSVIYNLLNLIYPDEKQWIDAIGEYPLSYGSLRNNFSEIGQTVKKKERKIEIKSNQGKADIKKLLYFIDWNFDNEIRKFIINTEDKSEKSILYGMIRDYFYTIGDYYTAVSFSTKAAETLYNSTFSSMDKETFEHLYPLHYKSIVLKYATQYSVDPALVFAIMREESHYNKDILSYVNAVGLMQIMPSTATWLSKQVSIPLNAINLTDPDQNIHFGVYYLSFIMNKVSDIQLVMAGYNAGHNRAVRWEREFKKLDAFGRYEYIPFEETRHYIRKVYQSYEAYRYILENSGV